MVRIKQRYLLFNILYPTSTSVSRTSNSFPQSIAYQAPTPEYLDAGRLIGHLRQHISLLFGDLGVGLSSASLKIIYFSSATSTIILRVPRNHHRLVWAALTHINELPAPTRGEAGKPCVIRVVRVSGTIRKAEEELIRRTRRDLARAKLVKGGEHEIWPSATSSDMTGKSKPVAEAIGSMMFAEDAEDSQDEESE